MDEASRMMHYPQNYGMQQQMGGEVVQQQASGLVSLRAEDPREFRQDRAARRFHGEVDPVGQHQGCFDVPGIARDQTDPSGGLATSA